MHMSYFYSNVAGFVNILFTIYLPQWSVKNSEALRTEKKDKTWDHHHLSLVFSPCRSSPWQTEPPRGQGVMGRSLKLNDFSTVGLPLILSPSSPSESLSDWNRSLNSFLSSAFFSWTFFRLISGRSRSSIFSNTKTQLMSRNHAVGVHLTDGGRGTVTLSFPEISSWISFSLIFFHWL